MNKIKIVYVDDEINQHLAMESLIPSEWELICFESPIDALVKIADIQPTLIISDQRMPKMQGFQFLETAAKICPDAIRIITTGYSDESSVLDSIRRAHVYDYIIKPWDCDKLVSSLNRCIEFHETARERKSLEESLKQKNTDLVSTCEKLSKIIDQADALKNELKCWVNPFVLAAAENKTTFPLTKNLALLVFDIINSSNIHGTQNMGQELRTRILQTFWEIVLKHGGEVESQEGDKGYATFGLMSNVENPSNAAYAAAKEFRSSLQGINDHFGSKVEAGIAIHFAENCLVHLRQVAVNSQSGILIRKKFDTSSLDVDLCHRMESLCHHLQGSNIILSDKILKKITASTNGIISIGETTLKGQKEPCSFHILKSNYASDEAINKLKDSISSEQIYSDNVIHLKSA